MEIKRGDILRRTSLTYPWYWEVIAVDTLNEIALLDFYCTSNYQGLHHYRSSRAWSTFVEIEAQFVFGERPELVVETKEIPKGKFLKYPFLHKLVEALP